LSKWIFKDEPSTTETLMQFQDIFRLNFEIYNSVHVNGDIAHPIFKYLKSKLSGTYDDTVKWNFSKFLIDKNGIPYKRFSPTINPIEIEEDIQLLLNRF